MRGTALWDCHLGYQVSLCAVFSLCIIFIPRSQSVPAKKDSSDIRTEYSISPRGLPLLMFFSTDYPRSALLSALDYHVVKLSVVHALLCHPKRLGPIVNVESEGDPSRVVGTGKFELRLDVFPRYAAQSINLNSTASGSGLKATKWKIHSLSRDGRVYCYSVC